MHPYLKMPELLRRYEYYIDVKRDSNGELLKGTLSKTALEALACGVKVITCEGKIVEALPLDHRPENVAKKTFNLYLENLKALGLLQA
jgi:hypothetical protein